MAYRMYRKTERDREVCRNRRKVAVDSQRSERTSNDILLVIQRARTDKLSIFTAGREGSATESIFYQTIEGIYSINKQWSHS